ncbi:hypothetical protein [Alkalihalobacillus deserti]|uniref:hypothetical protein n=1 Tax=Alkalihalobacillus deserti TaxID=2879466 RepID=UPI001D15BBEE|nr:hypothetical protein [Alkalihalobacillus deserti]
MIQNQMNMSDMQTQLQSMLQQMQLMKQQHAQQLKQITNQLQQIGQHENLAGQMTTTVSIMYPIDTRESIFRSITNDLPTAIYTTAATNSNTISINKDILGPILVRRHLDA